MYSANVVNGDQKLTATAAPFLCFQISVIGDCVLFSTRYMSICVYIGNGKFYSLKVICMQGDNKYLVCLLNTKQITLRTSKFSLFKCFYAAEKLFIPNGFTKIANNYSNGLLSFAIYYF